MKRFFIFSALLISIFCAERAGATGVRVGGGGNAVVCNQSAPELLDLWEAREVYGRVPMGSFSACTIADYIAQSRRLLELALGHHHRFLRVFDEIKLLELTMELTSHALPATHDTGTVYSLKSGCELEQIAIRNLDLFSGRLLVSRKYWESVDSRERAFLLMHEASHGWFQKENGSASTEALRQMVGLLFTGNARQSQLLKRLRYLIELRFPLAQTELTESALR